MKHIVINLLKFLILYALLAVIIEIAAANYEFYSLT
jgi:hypothetical protein